MEYSPKYHLAPGLGLRQLQALAAKHVVAVEVIHRVLHAAYPTELVLAFRANHVVTTTVLLFNNQTALGAVGDLSFVLKAFKIHFHCIIKLRFTVFLFMVRQAAFHADLVKASSARTMVWVYSSENAISLFLEM